MSLLTAAVVLLRLHRSGACSRQNSATGFPLTCSRDRIPRSTALSLASSYVIDTCLSGISPSTVMSVTGVDS